MLFFLYFIIVPKFLSYGVTVSPERFSLFYVCGGLYLNYTCYVYLNQHNNKINQQVRSKRGGQLVHICLQGIISFDNSWQFMLTGCFLFTKYDFSMILHQFSFIQMIPKC